ncbi:exported protein of unknown function [Cupriavidus taiwanensis]|nr:exported protein of unknown function [Cupriavidus taiwanensis]
MRRRRLTKSGRKASASGCVPTCSIFVFPIFLWLNYAVRDRPATTAARGNRCKRNNHLSIVEVSQSIDGPYNRLLVSLDDNYSLQLRFIF